MVFKKIKIFKNRKIRLLFLLGLLWLVLHCAYVAYDGLHDYKGNADVAIILGNTVFPNGALSPWLKARGDAALQLYRTGRVKTIFASGGSKGGPIPEGDAMRRYLINNGVSAKDIIVDNHGENSYLTAKDFIKLNDSLHFSSAIVVSSFYHITRCKYIIKKLGFDNVQGFASHRYFINDAFGLFREFFAFYKYVLWY